MMIFFSPVFFLALSLSTREVKSEALGHSTEHCYIVTVTTTITTTPSTTTPTITTNSDATVITTATNYYHYYYHFVDLAIIFMKLGFFLLPTTAAAAAPTTNTQCLISWNIKYPFPKQKHGKFLVFRRYGQKKKKSSDDNEDGRLYVMSESNESQTWLYGGHLTT